MKIQNIANTITADRAAFVKEWDTLKSHNAPFLIEEYYIATLEVSEYDVRVAVLDEDQIPVVTAVVDIYDNMDEAKRQLAFVGSIAQYITNPTDAQLVALLDSYEFFVDNATFPEGREEFEDHRLVKNLMGYVNHGNALEKYFTVPEHTRKHRYADFSQHPFRAAATQIVEKVVAAS